MRFPSRLLAANAWYALMLWAGLLAFVGLLGAVIASVGTLEQSVWEQAAQIPRWYGLFFGVALVWEFLPLYIAHGRTRRQFGNHAVITATLFAPFLSVLIVVGYLLETGIFRLAGLSQSLDREHLFTAPTQVPMVFAEYTLDGLTWIAVGTFLGAAFYRWRAGGAFTIPVGIALVALTQSALGTDLGLLVANIGLDWGGLANELSHSAATIVAVPLGAALLGLALSWSLIREVPLRNNVS